MPFPLDARPDKNALRHLARQRRRSLTAAQRSQAQQRVADCLATHIQTNAWQHIAAYFAVASELDLAPLFAVLPDIQLALPAIDGAGVMGFRVWRPGEPLQPGPFNIAQPAASAPPHDPRGFDVVLLPLLGFDRRGVRLGSGAGYYDRSFAFRHTAATPRLVGVGFAVQQFDALPADPWDVRLDAVVSEDGWLDCRG